MGASNILNVYLVNTYLYLSGGNAIWHMALHSFLADITHPQHRALRLATSQFAMSLPRPIAPLLGAFLYDKGIDKRKNYFYILKVWA